MSCEHFCLLVKPIKKKSTLPIFILCRILVSSSPPPPPPQQEKLIKEGYSRPRQTVPKFVAWPYVSQLMEAIEGDNVGLKV